MPKILIVLLFICIENNISFKSNTIDLELETKSIYPNTTRTLNLKYQTKTNIIFENTKNDSVLQINIHSINCKIEAFSGKEKKNNTNLELFYFKVSTDDISLSIMPLIDIVEGEPKEDYSIKYCPLTINSYYVLDETLQKLRIENKEENFIFFDAPIYKDTFNIFYEIKKVSKNSFISLFFRYEKETSYGIDITYTNSNNNSNSISKIIEKTSFIYLDSKFLLYDNDDNNGILSINITNISNINASMTKSMFFKIIEENNTCLLEKDTLNFGFITSKSQYQYYYTEILPGEEGELMLHNKRLYGVLYAKIINKSDISDINNISEYPNENENKTELKYNEHKLQLLYSYNYTSHCLYGCYILITYEQKLSEEYFPLIGYEYTILSRTWNYTDSVSNLITIPPNEYIISCFGQGSSPQHFYSIHIPNDTYKIKIQLEGNYFESYYIKERKKINIWSSIDKNKTELFQLNNNRNVTILYKKNINGTTDLSLLFFSLDFFDQIFSYYYFRVLFIKNDENSKYLPIDSNLGNLCLPDFDSTTNLFYCYLILKNKYNELNSTKFAISTENQNEYVNINTSIMIENKLLNQSYYDFTYVNDDLLNKSVDYILFKFEFQNNETKIIISSFCDRIGKISPPVYSGLMYYLDNFTKTNNFETKNNYSMKFQFIYGEPGYVNYTIYPIDKINLSENFRGKPITIQLDKNISSIPFFTDKTKYIFYYRLMNNMKFKGAEEITVNEPLIKLMKNFTFPLYYYLKIKSKKNINIDANIRLKSYLAGVINNKYEIQGYIIDYNTSNKIINGEYFKLENPIQGEYSDIFGNGFLHVNNTFNNNAPEGDNYLIIKIDNKNIAHLSTEVMSTLEISVKEYEENKINEEYLLPVNKYIIEYFDDKIEPFRDENKYCIYIPEGKKYDTWIELSTDYDGITLNFDNEFINKDIQNENNNTLEKGFKKYKINNTYTGKITFSAKINLTREAKYLIKYSYHNSNDKNVFIFDDKYDKKVINSNKDFEDYNFTFNCIQLITSSEVLKKNGSVYFITGTLYEKNEGNYTNNTYILNEINSSYVNKTMSIVSELIKQDNWTLEFRNFPKNNTKEYELQIQIFAFLLDNLINEEYFLYKIDPDIRKKSDWWKWLVGIGVVVIALLIALIILIKYLKLKKKNANFQQEMKSLLFSNDIQKNVLIKEKNLSKNESDFESTFI